MLKLLSENYSTYTDDARRVAESHGLRLFIFLVFSVLAALFASDASSSVYSMMATGVTVLTGFTFTALFSDHALAASGLPKPKSETDRFDLKKLKKLSRNFRCRSSYFIALSIIEILLLAAVSYDLQWPKIVEEWWQSIHSDSLSWTSRVSDFVQMISPIFRAMFVCLVVFIYLECLYTFYRMAETILAILDTRRSYLNLDEDQDSVG